MPQVRRIVCVGPFYKPCANLGQFAEFLFQGIEIVESEDIADRRARNPSPCKFGFAAVEDRFGGAELLEQQVCNARSDTPHSA